MKKNTRIDGYINRRGKIVERGKGRGGVSNEMIGKKVEKTGYTRVEGRYFFGRFERGTNRVPSIHIQVSCGFWVSGVFCEAIHH